MSDQLSQAEIEKLLKSAAGGKPDSPAEQSVPPPMAAQSGVPNVGGAASAGDDPGGALNQDEIEKLLQQAGRGSAAPAKPHEAAPAGEKSEGQPQADIHPSDLEYLFRQAEQALASLDADATASLPPGVSPFEFTEFTGAPPSTQAATLDLLKEVELDVRIELGKTRMYLEDVLRLRKGTVVTLDKLAGDPVDIYVNGRLVARGEVLVLNDNFCIRVAELVAGKEPHLERDV
jgi:flagellar motor switch protein FliN/FliY